MMRGSVHPQHETRPVALMENAIGAGVCARHHLEKLVTQ